MENQTDSSAPIEDEFDKELFRMALLANTSQRIDPKLIKKAKELFGMKNEALLQGRMCPETLQLINSVKLRHR